MFVELFRRYRAGLIAVAEIGIGQYSSEFIGWF